MQQRIRRQNLGCSVQRLLFRTWDRIFSVRQLERLSLYLRSRYGKCAGLTDGLGKFLVFGIIVSIGMSLGGLTGYAINPARDIGPRLAHAVLPIKGKGTSNWGYAVVPLVGPVIGAIVAVLLYGAIPW